MDVVVRRGLQLSRRAAQGGVALAAQTRAAVPLLPRTVGTELLDTLSPADPRAQRSRRDLRRVNSLMMNSAVVARELKRLFPHKPPKLIAEIGAGDGHFMLQVARRLPHWSALHVLLIDRQSLLAAETVAAFRALGWRADTVTMDVHAWFARETRIVPDVIVANLFMHHFEGDGLTRLLQGVAQRTGAFIACEPRRSRVSLSGARLLGLAGCNDVTRHDAVASVHAGFSNDELTQKWPAPECWTLREHGCGLFGHCFVAVRAIGEEYAAHAGEKAVPGRA